MKRSICIFLIGVNLGLCCNEPGIKPQEATHPVAWENLIANPNEYDQKLIIIDGWMSITEKTDSPPLIRVFIDSESLRLTRNFRFIDIDSHEFLRLVNDKGKKLDIELHKSLQGKFVELTARFSSFSKDQIYDYKIREGQFCVGKLTAPIFLITKEQHPSNLILMTPKEK